MNAARLLCVFLIAGLTACDPGRSDRQTTLRLDEEPTVSSTTRPAEQPRHAESDRPWFRPGVYTGRVLRRFTDVQTQQVPLEKLLALGTEAYDELLRFEMDRSFMRRYDPVGWEAFKSRHRLDDLEIPAGSEVDIGFLVVPREERLGFVVGNHPIVLAQDTEEQRSLVPLAKFSGRQVTGEWHTFRKGRSFGVAIRFTPREDSGYYSIRSASISDARDQGLGEDVLFYYGLNIFSNRLVVELAILYRRGPPGGSPGVTPWPAEEFRLVFQEKAHRDFGDDHRAFERYLLETASFLSQED